MASIGGFEVLEVEIEEIVELDITFSGKIYFGDVKLTGFTFYLCDGVYEISIHNTMAVGFKKELKKVVNKVLSKTIGKEGDKLVHELLDEEDGYWMVLVLLLMDLKLVEETSVKLERMSQGRFYTVMLMGETLLTGKQYDINKQRVYGCFTPELDEAKAFEWAFNKAEQSKKRYGNLSGLAVLQGKMDWNLSVDDYISFVKA